MPAATAPRIIQLTDDQVILARRLQEIREESKILRDEETRIRSELVDLFSAADQGVTASGKSVVTITRSSTTKVSRTKLEALFPAVYDECLDEDGETTTIKIAPVDPKLIVTALGILDD